MTTSYLFGEYYYLSDIIKLIDSVKDKRVKRRLSGETMTITFADELKLLLSGGVTP